MTRNRSQVLQLSAKWKVNLSFRQTTGIRYSRSISPRSRSKQSNENISQPNSRIVWATAVGPLVTLTCGVWGTAANTVDLAALVEGGGVGTAFTLGGPVLATGANGTVVTTSALEGLVAYLLDNVSNGGKSVGDKVTVGLNPSPLTYAEAQAIATAILADVAAGNPLTLAGINTAINSPASVWNSDLDGTVAYSLSTGTVPEILRLVAGDGYSLPSGSQIGNIVTNLGLFDVTVSGSTPTTPAFRRVYLTGDLQVSLGQGVLSELIKSTYTYRGVTGRAVTVYNDDGSLLG